MEYKNRREREEQNAERERSERREDRPARGTRGQEGVVAGRNAVAEALRSGRPIDTLYVARGLQEKGGAAVLAAKARQAGIPVKEADPKKLDALCGGAVHQGVVALAAA